MKIGSHTRQRITRVNHHARRRWGRTSKIMNVVSNLLKIRAGANAHRYHRAKATMWKKIM